MQSNQDRAQAFIKMLENCKHFDPDNRYTGALDLCNEIIKSPDQLEESMEKKICAAFISHLEDASLEVKSNAVKCIQRTASKIREANLITIVQKLTQEIVDGDQKTLDIFSLTVRGIVNESSEDAATGIITNLMPHMQRGIETKGAEIKEECLDILTDVFKRFGILILRQQQLVNKDNLMRVINTQLTQGSTPTIRKKASFCMGAFAVVLNNKQLQQLVALIIERVRKSTNKSELPTLVQCLSLIAKSVGSKLTPFLQEIIPLLQSIMMKLDAEKSEDQNNELSEACMNTLHSIIRKCPREVTPFVPGLFTNALELLEYDPNYTYDDDENMANEAEVEDWGSDFEDDQQEAINDDDDSSWKVRRSAIKIIEAIIKTRPEFIKIIVQNYQLRLVSRFKERIDDVKIDLLDTFRTLLGSSVESGNQSIENALRHMPSISKTKSYNTQINDKCSEIIGPLIKQMQSKSLKVRISSFACLAELSRATQFAIDKYITDFFPLLEATVDEHQSPEPLLYALRILLRLFRSYQPGTKCHFFELVPQITQMLIKAAKQHYAKVISEALHTASGFINALKDPNTLAIQEQFVDVVQPLFDAVFEKLSKTDIDQIVKQSSIMSAATVITTCHNVLKPVHIQNTLQIFGDRLSNELTRDATLRALTMISLNNQKREMQDTPIIPLFNLDQYVKIFFDLLKKTQRQLHLSVLECLEAFTRRYPSQFASQAKDIQAEIAAIIDEKDLQQSALAMGIATNLIKANTKEASTYVEIVNSAIQLSNSELVQGVLLLKMQAFFTAIAQAQAISTSQIQTLLNSVSLKSQSAAGCLAIVITQFKPQVMEDLWNMTAAADPRHKVIGILAIGQVGKIKDLSGEPRVLSTVTSLFKSPNDDVRTAASICLGNVSVGNPGYLDKVFELVDKSKDDQKYLFLNTIREIIIHNAGCLEAYNFQLTSLLLNHTEHPEDSIRTIVAESIGRLFHFYPDELLQPISNGLQTGNEMVKETLAKSIKYSVQKDVDDPKHMLEVIAIDLIALRQETNPNVKRNALEALSTIVHFGSMLVKDNLGDIVQFALVETPIRKELIDEIDLGPFKHKVDRGLPLRKAAFQTLETVFLKAPDYVDVLQIVDAIVSSGLADTEEDNVVLTLHILAKLTQKASVVVMSRIENIVAAFEKLFQSNFKLISQKQSQERAMNIIRAVLRVVYAFASSSELQETPVPRFTDFLKNIVLVNADAKQMYERIALSAQSGM